MQRQSGVESELGVGSQFIEFQERGEPSLHGEPIRRIPTKGMALG